MIAARVWYTLTCDDPSCASSYEADAADPDAARSEAIHDGWRYIKKQDRCHFH